ncbi:MAG: vitamin B12-dependent ribonucleotide reductase, partial [bacterium]|nr:vitamin B12-dependent ribonucleotide reductase [bacterium]
TPIFVERRKNPQSITQSRPQHKGLKFERVFSREGVPVFDTVEWEHRDALILNDRGEVVFEQRNVEMPKSWSALATNVVVSKYFKGGFNTPDREHSLKQLIHRVTRTITDWGLKDGYFQNEESAEIFYDELTYIMLHQIASFNSPVWFNVGVEEKPQCSACFINSVEDTMDSILNLAKIEGMLFKFGSGTGTNFSTLRSSREKLSGGGNCSGPVSFMRGYDAFAGVIKSGGKTRRAAKMVILNVSHPDIIEFIECKAKEEKKAWALIEAGYDGSFGGEAYNSVFFQNSNNSVRVPDSFMQAVEDGGYWQTRAVKGNYVIDTFEAKTIFRKIAEAAWICGDPGLQFDTTINDWHTCPNTDRIYASNPCSEYMFLDNSACNLASINLLKFGLEDRGFDVMRFRHTVQILILAQEIIVDHSSYPTEKITKNSHEYRPLGLGYANLGALLMSYGLPYDSSEGRATAGAITALMTGEAYRFSAEIARDIGPFEGFEKNREPFLRIIRKHEAAVDDIPSRHTVYRPLLKAAQKVWDDAYRLGSEYGFRNAQVTVIAPTGTIAFMMDCDTTGIEPDISLVKYKRLSDGGVLKIVNQSVPRALRTLGYSEPQIEDILKYIDTHDTIEGAPHLKNEDLPVFDCSFKPRKGQRFIPYMAHIKMMAAAQPFISGAISKTVNMPENATVEDIEYVYMQAWKLGLKSIAIYRENSKRTQPLSTSLEKKETKIQKSIRRRLPDERRSITHKFQISGHEGYLTVGMYEDGTPGEIFLKISKEGSIVSGLSDAFATAISLALQYQVPLSVLTRKFQQMRFEPWGPTGNKEIPFASSITDYIFRWLEKKFMTNHESSQANQDEDKATVNAGRIQFQLEPETDDSQLNLYEFSGEKGPACPLCGSLSVRRGSCFYCPNDGTPCGGCS